MTKPQELGRVAPASQDAQPTVDLTLTSDVDGLTATGDTFPKGSIVTYLGHVLGGMVKGELTSGLTAIVHPHCFANFR